MCMRFNFLIIKASSSAALFDCAENQWRMRGRQLLCIEPPAGTEPAFKPHTHSDIQTRACIYNFPDFPRYGVCASARIRVCIFRALSHKARSAHAFFVCAIRRHWKCATQKNSISTWRCEPATVKLRAATVAEISLMENCIRAMFGNWKTC